MDHDGKFFIGLLGIIIFFVLGMVLSLSYAEKLKRDLQTECLKKYNPVECSVLR